MARGDAVLLIAFGGPETAEEVRPFLQSVLRGRPVPRERFEEVVRHYEIIGGRSPLNALTFRQAEALATLLRAEGPELPVYVGMRNWRPYVADTLARMQVDGVRRALGLILAPHRTEASWERYTEAVEAASAALPSGAPAIEYVGAWFDHPLFVEAVASRVREALTALGAPGEPDSRGPASALGPPEPTGSQSGRPGDADRRRDDSVHLVFTAHSVPESMAAKSAYVREFETSSRLVAAALGHTRFSLAYQSRSGSPCDPWLEPDVNDVIRDLAAAGVRRVVLIPIGFVCDHVEVLYDLDVEARTTAESAGVGLVRAGTVNDHPAFVSMLAELVRAHLGGA